MEDRQSFCKSTWALPLFCLTVAITVFSQITPLSKVMRPAMYIMWGVLFLLPLATGERKIHLSPFTKVFAAAYGLFFLFCLTLTLCGQNHMKANYLRVLVVPLFVTLVGDIYRTKLDRHDLECIAKVYIICSLIFAIWVHVVYFPSYSEWLKQMRYAYASKNSAVQVWSVSVFLLFFFIDYRWLAERILGIAIAGYLIFLCAMTQGRTALLAIAFAYCAFVAFKVEKSKKIKWIAISILAACFLWLFLPTRQFIVHSFYLDKYAGVTVYEEEDEEEDKQEGKAETDITVDLNTFSSGRIGKYKAALRKFASSPIWGVGKNYVDCSYILILAESGIIGFLLIELVWLSRALCNVFSKLNWKDSTLLLCLTCFYFVESALEGYPPFGPGVCCFMFWFLSNIICEREAFFLPKQRE